jgi:hypothetical protein
MLTTVPPIAGPEAGWTPDTAGAALMNGQAAPEFAGVGGAADEDDVQDNEVAVMLDTNEESASCGLKNTHGT